MLRREPGRARKWLTTLSFFALLASQNSFAAESEYLHQPRISARVMGMGGAFVALADDYNALYYNPAGLARLDHSEFNFQIDAGLTPTVVPFVNSISNAGSSVNNITNILSSNYGAHYSLRAGVGMTYAHPGWAIGLQPVDLTAELDINANAGASVGVQAYQDSTFQFGLGWNIGKYLSFGIAPKAVYRAFIEKDILALDLVNNSQILQPSDASEGLTFDTDVGFIFTVPTGDHAFIRPSFGVAVRNAIDEGFKTDLHLYSQGSSPITNVDGNLGRRIDIGTKMDLPEFWAFKPRILCDFRDIGYRYASPKKSLHFGAELPWQATGSITGAYRVGMSEGYFTAGFSFYLSLLQFDVATYSEEIGTTNSPKESRRYIAQFSLDF